MKKVLQQSYHWLVLLIAWFAVSVSAMAGEPVTIDLTAAQPTAQNLTISWGEYAKSTGGIEFYNASDGYALTLEATDGFTIAKVEFSGLRRFNQWSSNFISFGTPSTGFTTQSDALWIWESEEGEEEVTFKAASGGDCDFYCSTITVTLNEPAPSDPVDYTVTAPSGVDVTIFGDAVQGGVYNTDKKIKDSDVKVSGVPSGYKAEVAVDNRAHTVTVTLRQLVLAHMTAINPEGGTLSLDDNESGLSYITITMDTYLESGFSFSSSNAPDGFTITDESGTSYPFYANGSEPYVDTWWGTTTKYNSFYINVSDAIKTPGTYTLHIPAGAIEAFEEGKANEEINVQWTIKAAEQFRIDGWENVTADGERNDYAYKSLTGFTVTAPSGVTFGHIADDAKVQISAGYDEEYNAIYNDVPASITIVDGSVKIVFTTPYTVKGSYSFTLTEGAIVATDGRTSKPFRMSASVDPNTYFSISMASALEAAAPVSSFDITLPEGVTVASVGESFTAYNQPVSVTSWTQNGTVLTINFADDVLPNDVWFNVSFPEGFVTAENGSISSSANSYNHKLNGPSYTTGCKPEREA